MQFFSCDPFSGHACFHSNINKPSALDDLLFIIKRLRATAQNPLKPSPHPALGPTSIATFIPDHPLSSSMPNQIIPLTPDEEAHLQRYHAQERAATLEIQPRLEVDPILIAMSSQETAIPFTSSSSLGLSLTSTPSSLQHPALSFSAQVPLGYPAARGASTPSSTFTAASPFGPATLPTERLAQRRAIKRN